MPKRDHTIRSLLLGRVSCACGWYIVVDAHLAEHTRMTKTDWLLDQFNDHSREMAQRGL